MTRIFSILAAFMALAACARSATPPAPTGTTALPAYGSFVGAATPPFRTGNGVARQVPTPAYYQNINALYDGDYKSALDGFNAAASIALRTASGRWIDSICYRTMIGECYYKMGRLGAALENYNAAVKLSLESPNWMIGIQFPAVLPPPSGRSQVPWGRSARTTTLARLPSTMALVTDQDLVDPTVIQGGGAAFDPNQTQTVPGTMFPQGSSLAVNSQEIVRCIALALKRRYELMGPICPHDALTASVAASLARRSALGDPISRAWVDAELGMAYFGTGQTAQAVQLLKRSTTLSGDVDHSLTPMVLLTLGELSLQEGDAKSARKLLAEASYSAFDFGDLDVVEESFRDRHRAFLMTRADRQQVFSPLAAAIPWSKSHGRELHASLLLLAADDEARLNHTELAASALAEAKSLVVRREAAAGEIGARLNCLSALVDYQQNRVLAGDRAITAAIGYEKAGGSRWLFQIALADRYAEEQSGSAITRQWALPLYDALLRDPTGGDWSSDPLESLAVLSMPLPGIYEHWFEAALQAGPELSLEVADRARRHRFFSTLPLGGRLMALRWALESPNGAIGPAIQLQRRELLDRYPRYAELAKAVLTLRTELAAAPLVAVGADARRKQSDQLAQLGKLSAQQEIVLRQMAVGREAADLAFPPLHKTKEVQAGLLPRQYMFVFFAEREDIYAWLLSNHRCAVWRIESPPLLEKKIATLLRIIGNAGPDYELPRNQLADATWQPASRDVVSTLVAGSKVNLAGSIDELIVVPDGVLWYLPFEALEVGGAGPGAKSAPLLAKTRVRYLPTMGLAMPDRQERSFRETGVAFGKLPPRDEAELPAELRPWSKTGAHVSALRKPLPAASPLCGSLFDSLVVLDDLPETELASRGGDPSQCYRWSLVPFDRVRSSGSLEQWFALPWKNPAQILLPGFHTPAENSLRQMGSVAPGNELFLSVCGLMSTGARTVLISRWRTGGQSSDELMRQFMQELPHTGAADAWQRSVQLLWQTPLDLDREPRVRRAGATNDAAGETTGSHPLLWSGYLLIDTGWAPPKAEKIAVAGK